MTAPRLPRYFTSWLGVVVLGVVAALHTLGGLGLVSAGLAGWLAFVAVLLLASRMVEGRRKSTDRLAGALITSAFGLALLPLVTLLWQVVSNGAPALSSTFFSNSMRNVVGEGGGIYHAAIGTLLVTGMAGVMSVPIGVLTAIYLVEYGHGRTARAITFLVDVMTGIPSIVAGLFAYAVFVLVFGEGVRLGFGGSVALSLLMIPLVVRSCEEMIKLVPNELREAAYALGVSKWRTIVKVVVPTALAGIVTGITIAVARVIGETAPLLIIAGTTDSTNFDLFNGRIMTLPVFIYSQYKNPGIPAEFSLERAWGAALVLMLIIMALNVLARLVSYYFSPKTKQ
ncbi:MAG: phosphate ABC transporter permease PstA [Propionibacteriales bacterium]|nr:phosphate ABC transporter permease PstA [Propionibacteriales bacterium]